jgi:ADP-ribose pyrophosphatase YjhB (NUDIX family)
MDGPPRDKNGLTEEEFLAEYDPRRFERPSVAVDDAADIRWFNANQIIEDPGGLAFDHARIIRYALERLRGGMR